MKLPSKINAKSGFTLVELVIVIVVLGILSAVAVPRFIDFSGDAKLAATRGALGGVRSAISNYYAFAATPSGGGVATYPTLAELTQAGVVMSQEVPENPYAEGIDSNGVTVGAVKGTATGASAWAYNQTTGEFWANTTSGAQEADL